MRDRKKRNIIIGSLCCLLVFMAVGYALLSQTLNINGIANLTGKWKIYIDSITVKEVGGSAKSNQAEVTEDKLTANFDVELLKPGDYVEYDVVVKNEGTINAVLRELIPNIESNNMDILLTHSIIQGQILKAESETKFTLKIRFDERATEIVSGGQTSFDIQMVYEQYDGDASDIDPSLVPVTANDCFTIDDNGVITDYDYSCGTYVTVPAVVNGTTVTEIDTYTFLQGNAVIYVKPGDPLPSIVVAQDIETYTEFSALLESMGGTAATGISVFMKGDTLPDTTGLIEQKGNIDSNAQFTEGFSGVEYLDLSQASGLKIINAGAFLTSKTNPSLKYLNLDGVNIETLGEAAFDNLTLKELTIDTDLYSVINNKFDATIDTLRIYPGTDTKIMPAGSDGMGGQITVNNLIIEEGITAVADYAFNVLNIVIRKVEFPESLVEIGLSAFNLQRNLTELKLPSKLKIIGNSAFFSCEALTDITIPASVERIENHAFANIYNLNSLTFEENSKLVYVGDAAFQHGSFTNLDFSPIKQKFEIGSLAFQEAQITELFIDDVKIFGTAFYNTPLEKIELVGNVELDERAFEFNDELMEVIIRSNTLKNIFDNTFKEAPLTKVQFLNEDGTKVNSSITHIGDRAFYNSVASDIILPTTIEEIGNSAFFSMPATSTITVNKAEGSFTTVSGWNGKATVIYNG